MEFPDLGKNCALKECNQLDFLPIKCDACSLLFCCNHYQYEFHKCNRGLNATNQVPVCPLCCQPVGFKRNELPDIAVSQHIDQYCPKNDRLANNRTTKKPNSNLRACSFKACKQKDVIYLECVDCRQKFCVRHRHPSDHMCIKPKLIDNISDNWKKFSDNCSTNALSGLERIKNKAHQLTKSGQSTFNRIVNNSSLHLPGSSGASSSSNPRNQIAKNIQGDLSEQEAISIAIAESKTFSSNTKPLTIPPARSNRQQVEEDLALARALHESQLEATRQENNRVNPIIKDSCNLS